MRYLTRLAATACIALLAAGCSSGGSGGSSSPSTAALGDVNALLSGHLSSACGYVPPSVQAKCRSADGKVTGLSASGTVKVSRQVVQGDEALVALTGKVCLGGGNTGSSCMSNSDASTGMPGSTTTFDKAFSAALSSFNSSNSSEVA